jgi:hypothetical protein
MEAIRCSETSILKRVTCRNIPEDGILNYLRCHFAKDNYNDQAQMDEMGRTCNTNGQKMKDLCLWWESHEERDHSEGQVIEDGLY